MDTPIYMPQPRFKSLVHAMLYTTKLIKKASARPLSDTVFTENTQHTAAMKSDVKSMQGVCMATDAGQYTALSESMNPVALNTLMNRYYETLLPAIKDHNGLVSEVSGDSVVALWTKPIPDVQLKIDACLAALNVKITLQECNEEPLQQLPSRMGLHYGEMCLDNTSVIAHYEYRVSGEIVKIATSIEGLNKIMRTRILVSSSVLDGIYGFVNREIGLFLFNEQSDPVKVFELVAKGDRAEPKIAPLLHAFAKALHLFQSCQWKKAHGAFLNINKYYPNDGPTIFYVLYLQKLRDTAVESAAQTTKPVIDIRTIADLRYAAIV